MCISSSSTDGRYRPTRDGWINLPRRGIRDRARERDRIGGGALLLVYALYRKDPVFIAGQALGLVVYIRNLYFILLTGRQSSAGD